jgi:hypothetical protein
MWPLAYEKDEKGMAGSSGLQPRSSAHFRGTQPFSDEGIAYVLFPCLRMAFSICLSTGGRATSAGLLAEATLIATYNVCSLHVRPRPHTSPVFRISKAPLIVRLSSTLTLGM